MTEKTRTTTFASSSAWRPPVLDETYGDIEVVFAGTEKRGGFGTVCFGYHIHLKREIQDAVGRRTSIPQPVAVKFNTAQQLTDPSPPVLFSLEQSRTARCAHDNIMPLYSYKDAIGTRPALIVMPKMDLSLDQLIRSCRQERQSLSMITVKSMQRDLMAGLKFLHAQNPPLVHSDLKPGNLFLRFNDSGPLTFSSQFSSLPSLLASRPFSLVIGDLGVSQREGDAAFRFKQDGFKHADQLRGNTASNRAFDLHAAIIILEHLAMLPNFDTTADTREDQR